MENFYIKEVLSPVELGDEKGELYEALDIDKAIGMFVMDFFDDYYDDILDTVFFFYIYSEKSGEDFICTYTKDDYLIKKA